MRSNHRAILDEYTVPLIDQLIGIVTAATVVAYSFYTFSAENLPENHLMMLTIPFVVYFLFRYLYLVQVRKLGGRPTNCCFRIGLSLLRRSHGGCLPWGTLFLESHLSLQFQPDEKPFGSYVSRTAHGPGNGNPKGLDI